jgi:hypothetical protein
MALNRRRRKTRAASRTGVSGERTKTVRVITSATRAEGAPAARRSRSHTIPTRRPWSTTGRWPVSVSRTSRRASSTVVPGVTVTEASRTRSPILRARPGSLAVAVPPMTMQRDSISANAGKGLPEGNPRRGPPSAEREEWICLSTNTIVRPVRPRRRSPRPSRSTSREPAAPAAAAGTWKGAARDPLREDLAEELSGARAAVSPSALGAPPGFRGRRARCSGAPSLESGTDRRPTTP